MDHPVTMLDPAHFALPWRGPMLAAAAVDLGAFPDEAQPWHLPPFPVIGIGAGQARDSAFARLCDVLVPDPAAAMTLCARCAGNPHAAAVLVQVLRLIEGLSPEQGLVAESLAYGILQGGTEHRHWQIARPRAEPQPPGQLHLERRDDLLAIVIDRPHARNSVDRTMRDALREAFDLGGIDPEIRRITLCGAGRTFCTGADLAEFGTTSDPSMAHVNRMQTLPALALTACAAKLHVHVDGACVGAGLEMAAFAARITATERAWFQLPELAMGLIPGAGGCVSLTRRIGRQATATLVLGGRRLSARAALALGLIDAITETGP